MAKQIVAGAIGGTLIGVSEYLNGLVDEESKKTAERFYPDTMAHIGYGFVAGSLGSIASNLYRPYSFTEDGHRVLDKLVKAGLQLSVEHPGRENLLSNLAHDREITTVCQNAFERNAQAYDLNDERRPIAEGSLAHLHVVVEPGLNLHNVELDVAPQRNLVDVGTQTDNRQTRNAEVQIPGGIRLSTTSYGASARI